MMRDLEIGQPINSEQCSEVADGVTRKKRSAEAGYRFYALYDKISREDILCRAYAQCRSNKRAHRVSTGRISRMSKRYAGWSGGLANWRLRSSR